MKEDNDNTRTHLVLTKGTMVSHYRIVEKIGAGGMGEVYLAEDTRLDRRVALKFLPPHLCQDEDCRKRFKREAQAAAKLEHPNIVNIHEVGEHLDRPFIVMQMIEGRSLREFAAGRDLALDEILSVVGQVAEGLQAAHEAGIVHRDIKPSNILIDSHGRARIVDFGLAVVQGGEHLTKTGSTLGTVGYMSPEQIGGRETDFRSDLFSLGVIFYELIAGRSPFKRDDQTATLKAVLDDTPEPLARYKADVPENYQLVVSKLLEKDPALRYQSAAGVISDLKRLATPASTSIPIPTKQPFWKSALNKFLFGCLIGVSFYVVSEYVMPLFQAPPAEHKMLAVLPFENLGAPEDEYFADGVTEEITTNLAKLSGLGVISRTSAMQYKDTDKSLKQIGKELGVDYVVEGTIRWDKSGDESRIRINPQLIQVDGDLHLWADRYDAVITDVFDVQAGIAGEIADALGITLLQSEQEALGDHTKVDPAAYDYYLRGRQYFNVRRYRQDEMRTAEVMHHKAIETAPDFAGPYAELGALYSEMHWDGIDASGVILDSAKRLIDIALDLAPNSPEVHQALGWYYYHGRRDYERSVEAFSRVLELQPNNALAIASIAWVERRQGKWESALERMKRTVQLAPRDPWFHYELGTTYARSGNAERSIPCFDRTTNLEPDNEWAYLAKSWATINQTGDPEAALQVIEDGLRFSPGDPNLTFGAVYYNLCAEEYDRALALLTGPEDVYLFVYSGGGDYYALKGWAYELMGQVETARPYLDSSRFAYERAVQAAPAVAGFHGALGRTYAMLAMRDEAIASARKATELVPVSLDALEGPDHMRVLASVYANVGEPDLAIEQLDSLLRIPSTESVKWMRIAPEYLPLRGHPRFQALLEKYDTNTTQ